MVKNLPAKAGDKDLILGQEDPLEEEMATHSSILAWEIPWTEEPGGLHSVEAAESDTTEHEVGAQRWERRNVTHFLSFKVKRQPKQFSNESFHFTDRVCY